MAQAVASIVPVRPVEVSSGVGDPSYPHVATTRLLHAGKAVTGVAITFTRPMDSTAVPNVGNYFVSDPSKVSLKAARAHDLSSSLVTLRSASYNPATSTVALKAQGSLKPSPIYIVSNENLFGSLKTAADYQRLLSRISNFTDTSGRALDGVGIFAETVSKAHPNGAPLL